MTKRFLLSFFSSVILLCVPIQSNVWAQWYVQSVPEFLGRSVQSVAEVSCANVRRLIVGTSEGIFIEQTGLGAIGGQWSNISQNLPTVGSRVASIRKILVKDSLIFLIVENQGVFATVVSRLTQPACGVLGWIRFGVNLPARVNDIILASNNRMYAATSQGVWTIQPRLSTNATLAQDAVNAALNTWENIDATLRDEVFSITLRPGIEILAGTRFNSVMAYSLTCPTTATCRFIRTSSIFPLNQLTVTNVATINADTTLRQLNNVFIRCNGVVMANTETDNLYFAPAGTTSQVSIDSWINISPAQYIPRYVQKINTILTGNFPGLPNSLILGTELGGILISDDCGRTWRELNRGLATAPGGIAGLVNADIRTIIPLRDSVFLAGANNTSSFVGGTMAQLLTRSGSRTITGVQPNQTKVFAQTTDTTGDGSTLDIKSIPGTDRIRVFVRVPKSQTITMTVYNFVARKMRDLFTGTAQAGMNEYEFDLRDLPNSVYFCRVTGSTINKSQKFLLVH
jgi:hypothetical protein